MPLAPEYQSFLEQLAQVPGPPLHELSPADARGAYRLLRPRDEQITVAAVNELAAPGPAGSIPLRVYRPEGNGPFPLVVNFHGGGWVFGDLDTADTFCRNLCRNTGCLVVSVDYRLAPEHPYPAAIDDAYAATCWLAEHASELEGNGHLAVAGESAGGNLAAAVGLRARDEGGPAIDYQLLFYPVIDADFNRPSYEENRSGYLLETATMLWFWDHYVPDESRRSQAYASPIRADDLGRLPPALILTAEFDPLRDEGNAFADALKAAGTPVELVCCAGLIHDFCGTAHLFESSRKPFEDACAALRRAMSGTPVS
jgi:acetyl esterase